MHLEYFRACYLDSVSAKVAKVDYFGMCRSNSSVARGVSYVFAERGISLNLSRVCAVTLQN